jgi:hypothetical protein
MNPYPKAWLLLAIAATVHTAQQKFTALLRKPLASSGVVRLKGAVSRWDTRRPEPAVLHADGRELRMY